MPHILTTNATVTCPHTGTGRSIPADPVWSVSGGIALVEGDTGVITGCLLLTAPCVSYTLQSMGLNASTIKGKKIILDTDFNKTNTGLPLIIVETSPAMDNTTPAPLPAGQTSAPLAPALLDQVKPIVVPATPALAFSISTQTPATLVASFSLSSAFPLQWMLTYISEPGQSNADWTQSPPTGVDILPSGGTWDATSPSLTVTVTLNLPFLSSLPVGLHHLYLIGVSQRGLSGMGESILTVTA